MKRFRLFASIVLAIELFSLNCGKSSTPTGPNNTAPGAPVLASPTNNAQNYATTLSLSWGVVSTATSYGVQVSTDANFGSVMSSQSGLTATSTTVSGLANGATYYWRANAANTGGTSGWCGAWSFATSIAYAITSDYTDTLPSALLKCFESLFQSGPVDVHIKNSSNTAMTFIVAVSIQDYTSSAGTATKTIAAGDTATLSPDVFIDPAKLATLSSLTQSNYQVSVSTSNGGASQSIYQDSHLVQLMARDALPWKYKGVDMSAFAALWVTPTNQAVQTFLATAKSYWDGNSWIGYHQAALYSDSVSGNIVVPPTNQSVWNFPSAGHGWVSGSITSSDNVQLRFEDTIGNVFPFCDKVTSATFNSMPFTGPGNMVLSSDNLLTSATVSTFLKYRYFAGSVRQQAKAIFNALKAKGITYSSTTISFPAGSQKIRLPSDALSEASANCIDGSVLMASALEEIGIEPLLILVTGHCFLGWRELSGSGDCEYLETTMIGTATFEDALNTGYQEYATHVQAGDVKIIDIKQARSLGLTPLEKRLVL